MKSILVLMSGLLIMSSCRKEPRSTYTFGIDSCSFCRNCTIYSLPRCYDSTWTIDNMTYDESIQYRNSLFGKYINDTIQYNGNEYIIYFNVH